MKIYKCNVVRTRVQEGILFIVASSEKFAKDPSWVEFHASESNYYIDILKDRNEKHEIVTCKEVTHLGQVGKAWRNSMPYYHPKDLPLPNEANIEDLLEKSQANEESINDQIKSLEIEKSDIEERISRLKLMLDKK